MEKDPNNAEVNADLKEARAEVMKKGGNTGFKKINIVEEDEDSEEDQEQAEMDLFEKMVKRYSEDKKKA